MLPLSNVEQFTRKHLRHNVTANVLDGGFFGFALGFAAFGTILLLFVASMTDLATLIGLVPAIHVCMVSHRMVAILVFLVREPRQSARADHPEGAVVSGPYPSDNIPS